LNAPRVKAMRLIILGLFLTLPLHAATFTVTKEADDDGPCLPDDCALREAVLAANEAPGADTIEVPGGEYRLTLVGEDHLALVGDLDLWGEITILGDPDAKTAIVGSGDRIFHGWSGAITLSDLTLTGGEGHSGGAIRTAVDPTLITRCTISDNHALTLGGAIYYGVGPLTLVDSTISNNSAEQEGGGIYRIGGASPNYGADLTLVNSTISGNTAHFGGGIYSIGWGVVTLLNSSVVRNDGTISGDAFFHDTGRPIHITNSVLEGTCGGQFGVPIADSGGGNVQSPGANCNITDPTDRSNVPDLLLAPLTSAYSNSPPVHQPWPGSPLIDSGVDAACESVDQLGTPRPVDGDGDGVAHCDVGPVEFVPQAPAIDIPSLQGWGLTLLALLLALCGMGRLSSRS
jgi:CSLREA domain-containing protein